MAEEGTPLEQPEVEEQTDGSDTEPEVDYAKEIEKWKALARKHEEQAKKNAEAAARLKEIEDAGKSETEKLQAALEDAQRRARESTVKALKLQIANEKGLPPSLAKFLPDTENEVDMMQAADELLEAAGSTIEAPSRRPKSNLTTPLGDGDPADDREKLLASLLGRNVK